ncbi:hypothetical protein RSAG8_13284, partial [Rhizoctonia solani AG-8 WAC10335]
MDSQASVDFNGPPLKCPHTEDDSQIDRLALSTSQMSVGPSPSLQAPLNPKFAHRWTIDGHAKVKNAADSYFIKNTALVFHFLDSRLMEEA